MSPKEEVYLWMRDLVDALKNSSRIAEEGGAAGLVNELDKMMAPFDTLIQVWGEEIEIENLVAKLAGVEKKTDDTCVISVPKHWIDSMRTKIGQSQEEEK